MVIIEYADVVMYITGILIHTTICITVVVNTAVVMNL